MDNDYGAQLISFYHKHRRMPSYTEMMALFGFKSKNAVYRVVTKLIAAGLVAKDALGKLIPSAQFDELPMAGMVKAGLPAPGELLSDTLSIEGYLVKKRDQTYLLEVDGDSMIEAHIADGDMVVAERTNRAKDGDIVIAQVDGEFTMKYFRTKGDKVWLEPANKAFKNIYPEFELSIVAIVRGVMRKY